MYIYIYIYIMYMRVYMYRYMCICVYVCVCVYIYIYICAWAAPRTEAARGRPAEKVRHRLSTTNRLVSMCLPWSQTK